MMETRLIPKKFLKLIKNLADENRNYKKIFGNVFWLEVVKEKNYSWFNLRLNSKVTKKGFFENENSVFKIFYLRITGELAKKWNNAKIQNWAKVLNQLSCLDETSTRIARYIR